MQLNGRANYTRYGQRLTLPTPPDQASDLLCPLLGDRQQQIEDVLMHDKLQAARRLVNGGAKGLDNFKNAWSIGNRLLPADGGRPPGSTRARLSGQ